VIRPAAALAAIAVLAIACDGGGRSFGPPPAASTLCARAERFLVAPGDEYGTPYYWETVRWYRQHCTQRDGGSVHDR
jgi:hypothetical protein